MVDVQFVCCVGEKARKRKDFLEATGRQEYRTGLVSCERASYILNLLGLVLFLALRVFTILA